MADRTTGTTATDADQTSGASAGSSAYRSVLTELGFVVVALVCYLGVGWYTRGRNDEAVANARDVLHLERLLGIDWEHPVQDATISVPGLGDLVTAFYVWGYFPLLICCTIWLYVRHREPYRRLRNALLASGVVGLVVYAVYPCAPPWIAGGGFTDTVAQGSFEAVARPSGITNHLGAIPSFHVGWLFLAALVFYPVVRTRLLRALCALVPALMAYAVVATGNHWVLDIPAGIVLALVGVLVAAYLSRIRDGVAGLAAAVSGGVRRSGPARHREGRERPQFVGRVRRRRLGEPGGR